MKKQILFFLCLMVSIVANAQYKVSAVDKQEAENIKLLQVLETSDRVLVYGTFTSIYDDHRNWDISRKAKVEKNNVSYKITNSVNMPIKNDAEPRFIHTTKLGDKVNFLLEFEKFDLSSGTFDIIEDENLHGNNVFNFCGIHLEKIDTNEAIDTKRFLNDSHAIFGYYKEDGHTYHYYIKDNVMLMYYNTWNGKDYIINLEITNNSDHGVMFDLAKVRQEGTDKKGKPVKVARYTPESYDNKIEESRRYAARIQTNDDFSMSLENKIYHERINATNEWAKLGLTALEQAYKKAQDNRVETYLREHPNTNPKALRSNSIKPGESLIGFIPFQVKNSDKFAVTINMDDYDFYILFTGMAK